MGKGRESWARVYRLRQHEVEETPRQDLVLTTSSEEASNATVSV